MNQRLLTLMRLIYSRYTGQEIADTIRTVRQEINHQKDLEHAQEEILRSQHRLDELHHNGQDAYGLGGVPVPKQRKSRTKLATMAGSNINAEPS